jgi:hypothetical protein
MSKTMRSAFSLVLVCLVGATLASSACAATYTVGTRKDTTGSCGSPPGGKCSLRQLIEYEDALPATPSPADTIVVPSGTYELEKGELTITQSLNIVGAGARTTDVDLGANGFGRVFAVKPEAARTPSVVISGLEISGGSGGEEAPYNGGDIYNSASLVLEEDWITKAFTELSGGGIANEGGSVRVVRSLVSANSSEEAGGAIENRGTAVCVETCSPGKKAILAIEDSTIAYNSTLFGETGGVISSLAEADDGNEVSVIDSTIAFNTGEETGAGLLVEDGTADIAGSIFDHNDRNNHGTESLENCATVAPGKISSLGYNLESGTECGFKSTGDIQDGDPEFSSDEPVENGGNTDTLALEAASPAIDAIPTSFRFCEGTDQRGISRPQGGGCDIGAVEMVPFTIDATEGANFSGQVIAPPTHGLYAKPLPTIEWGDGQKSNGTIVKETQVDGSHTYAQAGTYNGVVTYDNDFGSGVHRVHFQAKVADAPLTSTATPVQATPGVSFTGTVATFTDANPDAKASEYTVSINWGDGTQTAGTVSAAGKGFAVTGTHTYAAAGAYTTTVTVDDVGGSTTVATGSATVTGPPIVSNVTVLSVTETTATIGFTIDPDGVDTSYVVEYGHTSAYGLSTAPVDIGSAPAPQQLTVTLTGLEPGSSYHFDVVATSSQVAEGVGGGDLPFSTAAKAGSGVLGAKTSSTGTGSGTPGVLPPPVLGKTVNIELVSGKVFISLPTTGQMSLAAPLEAAFASLSKGLHFIPLTEARQIPVGSTLETTSGVARITTATATLGKTQTGEFGAGIFKLLQNRKQKGLTEMDIVDSRSSKQVCASLGKNAAVAARLSSKTLGRLNASAHGSFSTHGQYSASTVRGTVWTVSNQCNGTLTKVTRGEVSVRDFRRRKTVTLFSGQHYLARAPVS